MPNKKSSPAKKANGSRPKKRERANALDLADLREYLDEVHTLTDKMESSNARTRQNIGKIYERASAALNLTKKAVAKAFRKERAQVKEEAQEQVKGTAEDRDSYLRIASAYGDDSPIGQWASKLAAQIVEEGEAAEENEGEPVGGGAARIATVTPLRAPAGH